MDPGRNAMPQWVHELKQAVRGEVRFDDLARELYATDASDYRKTPAGVVIPRDVHDVQAAMEIAARHNIAIIPRGGGTSLSGQTVGAGLVIDHAKYLDRILEIDVQERWVRVQSGVVLDTLNASLAPHGLMVGPDPASSAAATLGGMTGNNSTGSHSFRYGQMADHILELEVVLADGSKALLAGMDAAAVARAARQDTLEGRLYRTIPALLDNYRHDIETGYPKTWRNVAGYRLNHLLASRNAGAPFSLVPLIAGSEGTLAAITEIQLGVVPRPAETELMILHFASLKHALDLVPAILEHQPAAVELMSAPAIMLADRHPGFRPRLRQFVQGTPDAILIVAFAEASGARMKQRRDGFRTWLGRTSGKIPLTHCTTAEEIANVWQTRKAVFGLLLSRPGDDKLTMIIDDPAVPVDRLAAYTGDVVAAGRKFGIDINFDAHASAGCLHMGLAINLKTRAGLQTLELLSKQIMEVALAHEGTTTGEHGEGLARSYFNEALYGPRLHRAFEEVKASFDPDRRLNPHKVVNPIPPWDAGWLRFHPGYRTPLAPSATFLDFSSTGGFAGLVEMCNGMGVCRSQGAGTMCPSFRVIRDEQHTTRGRANALRAAITGRLGPAGLADAALYQTMDLCLACKACRSECASKVDMAKLKHEFLAQYQARRGTPLRSRLIGGMAMAGALGSKAPQVANALYRSPLFRRLLHSTVGIHRRRRLPRLARQTFRQWFQGRPVKAAGAGRRVVLWDDCHVSYHEPEIGAAAVQVLEALGCDVQLIRGRRCCGRPMISKGLLRQARANARHNIGLLSRHARQETPIIGIEPSCIACFQDECPELVKSEAARLVAQQAIFFESFVVGMAQNGELKLPLRQRNAPRRIKLHTHCFQKAFGTAAHAVDMLKLLPDTMVEEIDSGCCGMAGAFGYEKEHYDLSMAIGELALFPSVRAAPTDTVIAAAGTSCRQQIEDGTRRKAMHPIVLMARALRP